MTIESLKNYVDNISKLELIDLSKKIYVITDSLCAEYPKYKKWFFTKQLPETLNSNERNILSQALKNHDVELFIKVRKANGVKNINTFSIIYLNEYEKSKLIKLKDTRPLINPSKEKTLKAEFSTVIIEFKFWIKLEKEISCPSTSLPTSLIAAAITEGK